MRFHTKDNTRPALRLFLPVLLFGLILLGFSLGVSSLLADTGRREKESLERALRRSITYCYAVEGSYPESLSYLTEHYGLTYDHRHFFVDYRITGSNLYPDVTVLEVNEDEDTP